MAEWYSAADSTAQERLLLAWPDAPLANLEVCGMLLEVAQEQVIAYAPASTPAVYEPVTLSWPDGSTLALARTGGVVTAVATPADPGALPGTVLGMPVEFSPAGIADHAIRSVATGNGQYILLVSEDAADTWPAGVSLFASTIGGVPPFLPLTTQWLADPAEGTGVPTRYVYAQLRQAENLWNAGRVSSSGDIGVDTFTFTPRPLDKTIKQIIRPVDGKPHVL